VKRFTNAEKIQHVLKGLQARMDRDEIARELGYKHYRSLDMFMRRQGYTWDRWNNVYLSPEGRTQGMYARDDAPPPPGRAGKVISLFSRGELDPREIAAKLGFEGHREMAAFMASKGFVWDSDAGNYVPEGGNGQTPAETPKPEAVGSGSQGIASSSRAAPEEEILDDDQPSLERYLPLLRFLEENEEALRDLLAGSSSSPTEGSFPRYAIPGRFVTKSVHMSDQLDQMVRDFSEEKNIAQRHVFEIALVEFFRKYGYKREIDALLGQG